MNWRYQPVWTYHDSGDRTFSVCEVYLDGDGKLVSWTADKEKAPWGESVDDLIADCSRMLTDAQEWAPVEYAAMEVGMMFDRADVDVMVPMRTHQGNSWGVVH